MAFSFLGLLIIVFLGASCSVPVCNMFIRGLESTREPAHRVVARGQRRHLGADVEILALHPDHGVISS